MSTDQTGLLYKSKYKFIEFQKKGSYNTEAKPSNESVEQPPDIKEFYSDLISSESVPREPETETKQRISRRTKQREASKVTTTSYFRACQNDEVSEVKDFLTSRPSSLNVTDQFGWNGLMIAIAGNSNRVLKYLFTHRMHNSLFKDLLETKDSTGTETAHSIALRSKNTHAIQLIDSWYTEFAKKEPEVILLDDDDNETPVSSKDSQLLCSICQTLYAPADESTHLTSIVHQLALRQQEEQPTTDKIAYNFHLGASNKGYQLLCKSGWEHRRGLGKQEQGLVFPIKAVPKPNRSGIGAESDKGETKSSKYVFDAKRLNLEKAKSTAGTSTSLESQLKHYKYAQKKRNKEKRLEKDFRSYYNSS